jgi:chemotaxis protein methyltransferase CheR
MIAHAAEGEGGVAVEVHQLVEDLYSTSGHDYRGWSPAVLARRLCEHADAEGVADLGALRARVLDDPAARSRLVLALAPRVGGPFPDVAFARLLREEVLPRLRTYPSIRIWHAGCSTGEEVYTTAILLREEGLAGRSRIYATDDSGVLLDRARSGRSDGAWSTAAARYLAAGGQALLDEYYRPEGGQLVARPVLRERMVFDNHAFASDASFNEFQLVICRGVIRQYSAALRQRALRVIHDSLCRLGYLALGPGEDARGERPADFEVVAGGRDLYRRAR